MTSKMIQTVGFPIGCELMATGIVLPDGLTFQQWSDIGELLEQARRREELKLFAIQCALGDWVNYGEHAYGEKYAQAIMESGRAYQTLANLAWITSKIEPERRRPHLSIAHHSAVAALPPPDADALLDMAEMENASSNELRRLVQNRKIRDQGKDPDVERAKRALDAAMIALTNVPRRQRAAMIIKHLVEPLAGVAAREREQFLSAMVAGCCEVE